MLAHVVLPKGASTEWVIEQLVRDSRRKFGIHAEVVLESDQELALFDLIRQNCVVCLHSRCSVLHSGAGFQ